MTYKISEVHLQNIQSNINRLATISFAVKGWSVTIVSGLLAILFQKESNQLLLVAYFPVFMFWLLDAYYLGMERKFVKMYNDTVSGLVPTHEIKPTNFHSFRNSVFSACVSKTILLFHSSIFIVVSVSLFSFTSIIKLLSELME